MGREFDCLIWSLENGIYNGVSFSIPLPPSTHTHKQTWNTEHTPFFSVIHVLILLLTHFQSESGKLSTDQPIRVKISGDGARMMRLTIYVILSYCLLDNNDDFFSARGMKLS